MKQFLFFLGIFAVVYGKSQDNDAAFWPGIKINHPFNDRISENLFIQERIENNITKAQNTFIDLCTSVKIIKNLNIEGAYVYVFHTNLDNTHNFQQQFYCDLNWKIKISKRFKFKYTPQFQMQWTDINTSADGKISEDYLRNKFTLEYRLKKRINPFAFIEYRTNLSRQPVYLNRTRYNIGTSFHLHHKLDIDVYYMIQKGYFEGTPNNLYIIGVNFCKEI